LEFDYNDATTAPQRDTFKGIVAAFVEKKKMCATTARARESRAAAAVAPRRSRCRSSG